MHRFHGPAMKLFVYKWIVRGSSPVRGSFSFVERLNAMQEKVWEAHPTKEQGWVFVEAGVRKTRVDLRRKELPTPRTPGNLQAHLERLRQAGVWGITNPLERKNPSPNNRNKQQAWRLKKHFRKLPFKQCACGAWEIYEPLYELQENGEPWPFWRWCYICGRKDEETFKESVISSEEHDEGELARMTLAQLEKLEQLLEEVLRKEGVLES